MYNGGEHLVYAKTLHSTALPSSLLRGYYMAFRERGFIETF